MQHNLEQQIQARNQSGVSEDALKEFSMMFKHFDKDRSGRLDKTEFKSCLRALGYDLPMVEEGQPDPEFEAILGILFCYRGNFCAIFLFVYFFRCGRSESRWLCITSRVYGVHDQQRDRECAKLRRD